MGQLLYITANPKTEETSFGLKAGRAFLEAYREANPEDEVIHVDVFQQDIPLIDADVLSAWGKLGSGHSFDDLSDAERGKVAQLGELVDQFIAADRYVFVSPLWNFGVPPLLKAYIDAVAVAGKTFRYTEAGPEGLLTGKKAVHIHATGGVYSEPPMDAMDFSNRYLVTVLGFLGVTDVETVRVEGMNQFPDRTDEILAKAADKARETAQRLARHAVVTEQ
ncbi:FMN-dependent NADH-azoreductase [Desmospora profundinema]|uniref:FMN dependent NADH:quinone oxidoreductase n=1 Tax=Desmospora profundinema TaxID=1571184 RepID=A0ABU1IT65_9BACL|nr:FMN-dependent NADH-azoreductase [Desmospora profundinema]MDR6227394.1 FMN-dependent NADH-azoreductase [Desmospora profundinema]